MQIESDWFSNRLLSWAKRHGRKDLPWQRNRSPYRSWIAEIMLQQTQVVTVIDFYNRFLDRFPSVKALAEASQDEVLAHWSGLGYYRRAKHLHQAARLIVEKHYGEVPNSLESLQALPGIGRSTAGAILAGGFDKRGIILDGNVKRVLARFHAIKGDPSQASVSKKLWQLAESHTPRLNCAEYTQAIMDLGATLCTRQKPDCNRCPVQTYCIAHQENQISLYPEQSKRTKLRDENLRLLVIIDPAERVLLQRQPEDGVWGSLWLPPALDKEETVKEALHRLNLDDDLPKDTHKLNPFVHTLTHIRFHVDASVFFTNSTQHESQESAEFIWHPFHDTSSIGIARITSKLLMQTEQLIARRSQKPLHISWH